MTTVSTLSWRDINDPTSREAARLRSFGAALTTVRKRVEADLGNEDVDHIIKLQRFSRTMEGVGRVLIHISPEPVSFGLGVTALWVHKQLQATEIGHTCLHGAYDGFDEIPQFHRKGFKWDAPIDERSWHRGHNLRHHQHTNVAGKDPDIHFGPVRLTEHTPHHRRQRFQVPYSVLFLWPNFMWTMNWHFSGLNDVYMGNGREQSMDFLSDRSWESISDAHIAAFRKYIPYFIKNYVFFPALAGPAFGKVLLGNWMAETMRDVYTAATIFCGHVGEDVAAYPEGTRAGSKGAWYAMQVESTHNYEVSHVISVLCGALDRQIEHHLFPRLTPRRLRQVAPEVKAICEDHDVRYQTGSWGSVLRKALSRLSQLSRPAPADAAVPVTQVVPVRGAA